MGWGCVKRFLSDEAGTAEATAATIMIAAVGVLLAAGIIVYYGHLQDFFGTAGSNMGGAAQGFNLPG